MRPRWRELFTSNLKTEVRWDRWDSVALVIGVLTVGWVFAFKLKTFYDLGYSGDLFASVQAARSWLEGKGLLKDNCWGNDLAIHTYFLLPPLGLVAKPFGAPGLLFVHAVSVGATYFCAARILRVLGVADPTALIAAAAILVSPLSVAFYQDAGHGFHVETLAPALCLILFYFLLQQRLIPSIVAGLAVISAKEDAPIAAAIVAIIAGVETWTSSAGKPLRCRFNRSAALTLLLSISAIPILLAISWAQSPTEYAPHSVDRLGIVAPGSLSSEGAFFVFVASNVTHWLGSSVVRQWLWIMTVGSFGTILLRPYYLVIGLPTTWVAWLVHGARRADVGQGLGRLDLLWPARFFATDVLLWCVTLVGFASIARVSMSGEKWSRTVLLTASIVIAALSASAQLGLIPWYSREAYLLRPSITFYSSQERQEADTLFARYRREAKPEEPVVASTLLFRYAHDRNLFWLNRLHNQPAPIWILGDTADPYPPLRVNLDKTDRNSAIRIEDYTLIDRRGRFVLMKKKD
jgi:hypothetical protein